MLQPLRSHIVHLETVTKELDDHLTESTLTPAERVRFTAELRTAQLALIHFRQGFELEQQFA